jgi:hypothetical protein
MLPAVVTEIGDEEVPLEKPFSEVTGPVNVVCAMFVSSHASQGVVVCMTSAGTVYNTG